MEQPGQTIIGPSDQWLHITARSPFTTLPGSSQDQQALSLNEAVSIPTTAREGVTVPWSSIFRLSWAVLLAQYGCSTAVQLEADIIAVQLEADIIEAKNSTVIRKAKNSTTVHVSSEHNIQTVLDDLEKQQQQFSASGSEFVTSKQNGSEDVQGSHVSVIMPWSSDSCDGIAGASQAAKHPSNWKDHSNLDLENNEILRLIIVPGASGRRFFFHVQYSSALGSIDVAVRIMHQFAHITRQIISSSTKSLQLLNMMPTVDQTTLHEWNSETFPPISSCFHHMVTAHAKNDPSTPAISAWDGNFNYGELDALSDSLASRLVHSGLSKGTIVPLLFEKSKWMVVSVLAVLKAGGACVGLCNSHPDSYVKGILEQTGAGIILCSPSQAHRLQGIQRVPWIVPDVLENAPASENCSDVTLATVSSDPSDLAFVIFTSGSTGNPKGVLLTHQSISTSAHYHGLAVNVKPTSRILQFSSYAFDMSVIETWYALARGGCLCIPSETQRLLDLGTFIQDHRASWAFFTPTMLRAYRPGDLPGLESIVLGGENVTRDLVLQWKDHARLFDLWGPAECAGAAGCEIVPKSWVPGTFGRGAGCHIWIVRPDDSDHLSPVGAVGELVIEGHIVGRGYLNDLIRTEQVFVSPPKWRSMFSAPVQGHFYKTGDLGQYNADGSVRYVSRKDTMVKINGQRVDVDAVEVAIRTLQPQRQVAVDAVLLDGRHERTDPVLIGFIETPAGAEWAEEEHLAPTTRPIRDPVTYIMEATQLQNELSHCLPRFMVPAFLIPLTRLPLGATGKVDKKRLRASVCTLSHTDLVSWLNPKSTSSSSSECGSPCPKIPKNKTEHLIVDNVAKILGMDKSMIDMETSFRQLGGDSVTAIQLARHLVENGLTPRVEDILTGSWTLTELAATVQQMTLARACVPVPFSLMIPEDRVTALRESAATQCGVSDAQIEDMYPCTPLQEGLLTLTTRSASDAYVDRFLCGVPPTTDFDRLEHAWKLVIERVPTLRTRIVQISGSPAFQVVIRNTEIVPTLYPDVDSFLTGDCAVEIAFGSPLFRLSRVATEPETLAITIHHAIYDGWTFSLLLRLVEQTYQGSSVVQPLPFSLFVQHLQQKQDSIATAEFWRREMADVQPITFPEYPAPDYYPRAATVVHRDVEMPLTTSSAPATVAGPTTRLCLAWAMLLSLYSGTQDVVFGNVMDGRRVDLPGIEAVAGPTLSTVPVRVQLQRQSTVRDMLQQMEETMTRRIPFEHSGLQNIARTGSDAALACQFRSLLVVQSDPEVFESPVLGNIEVRLGGGVQGFPGFGLILICHPHPQRQSYTLLVDEALVSQRQASQMLEQFSHLLHELREDTRLLGDIDLLCRGDRAQLSKWHSDIPESCDYCVQEVIGQRATIRPNKIALSAWDGDLTYAQLDRLSSIAASDLKAKGTLHGTVSCILFSHSRWVAVAILAAMKAGTPFIMLDQDQPQAHHQALCQRVEAKLVLTSENLVAQANGLGLDSVYVIGPQLEDLDCPSQLQIAPGQSPTSKDIAYIIFTSGSTGQPKGVMIEHCQFAAAAVAQQKHLHINSASRVLHLSSYAFDSFAVEILTTLCAGGTVCVPTEQDCRHDIVQTIRRFQATWMVITPSMLRLIDTGDVSSLETLVAVGESMLPAQAEYWGSRVRLLCGYGPTECCTGASAYPIDPANMDVRNIGAGMGSRLWLVHQENHHSLVPVGTIGEIIIQGPIVGRGYLNDPQKTGEVFLESADWVSQFTSNPQNRLYKTGDLGRYNEDGTCTFLGRISQQIKVRGQRLDLPVLEHHLHQVLDANCMAIAAVIIPGGANVHPVLVAMIHLHADDDPKDAPGEQEVFSSHSPTFTSLALRAQEALQHALSPAMVPSLFLQLPRWPLLVSGKVNRQVLQRTASALPAAELFKLGRLAVSPDEETLHEDESVAWTLSHWLVNIFNERVKSSQSASIPSGTDDCTDETQIAGRNVTPVRLGMDSIDMMAFARMIAREYDVTIPTTTLFQSSLTVRMIAEIILAERSPAKLSQPDTKQARWWIDYQRLKGAVENLQSSKVTTLCRDAPQTEHIAPAARSVFLTGGTGFLGSRLLQQLVVSPDVSSVVVLVRGTTSVTKAMARIIQSARLAQWWRDDYRRMIDVWLGDLALPQLGLSDDQWSILCGNSESHFDAIIHNGAMVHWVYDYDVLQASNVQSTFEFLRALSSSAHPTNFTYVSALRPGETQVPVAEEVYDSLSAAEGYSQTKSVSEMLIQHYVKCHGRHDRTFSIVRPGLMMGSVADGISNMDDVIWRTVSAAINAGGYNAKEDNSWIYIAPVDWVATVIVFETIHASLVAADTVSLTVLEDGLLVQDFWQAIIQATSMSLLPMDGAKWLAQIENQIHAIGKHHPLWPVIDLFQASSGCIGSPLGDGRKVEQPRGSSLSMIWMTVLRSAQYLTSMGYWEDMTKSTHHDEEINRLAFGRARSTLNILA
ncbi:uncharacterized protein N7511_003917 [Penicillium nucicola]|uniref:uncharacterized protein n=1 Tax=Penicillium nucicola TaxID=1850975 RepID=UPI002545B570|nr:uncharacterized protein N7511_003917 [Penicillium nucicola]KAJ5766301.1 hypothetical protein N7511_003917 [Penicillium nucicola]